MQKYPKGGDLHNHLSGAFYAESFIDLAISKGMCVHPLSKMLSAPPCKKDENGTEIGVLIGKPASANRVNEYGIPHLTEIIDQLSVRDYSLREISGHDQFFSTFARFSSLVPENRGDIVAEVSTRASRQNILYLELMQSLGMFEVANWAATEYGTNSYEFTEILNHNFIDDLKRRSITINGSALSWHDVESYLDNPNIGNFKIDTNNDNQYVPYPDTNIDAVIMMGCSLCPIHPERKQSFKKYVKEHAMTIRAKGSEPMLFMSWAYKNKPEMFIDLKKEFLSAANLNNLLLIPVGQAFYKFNNSHPDIDLYTSDLRHPSKEGSYMAAAVIFSTLYGRSTFGNAGMMNLTPEIAHKIQKVADETVEEFFQLQLRRVFQQRRLHLNPR